MVFPFVLILHTVGLAFLVSLLADDHWIKVDRWIHTGWSYIL